MHQLQQLARQNPQWSLDELVEVANQLLPQYLPDQGSDSRLQDTVNARLVRHYTTQGLLDRPLKQGREARYRYRHLLQLLLLRRLLTEGYSSSSLGQALQKSDRDLESLLQGGAQLTMEAANPALAFLAKVRDRVPGQPSQRAMAPPSVQSAPPPGDEARPFSAHLPSAAWPERQSTENLHFGGSSPPRSAPAEDLCETKLAPSAPPEEVEIGEPNPFEADFDLAQEAFADDVEASGFESDVLDDFSFDDFEAFEASEPLQAEAIPNDLNDLEDSEVSPSPDRALRRSAPASPKAGFATTLSESCSTFSAPPVTPDTSLWSRHTLLEGLELHLRDDFIYPTTPQERVLLIQLIDQWLRALAANPPSHPSSSNPSHRRFPP